MPPNYGAFWGSVKNLLSKLKESGDKREKFGKK
jgi:hypothetical protein